MSQQSAIEWTDATWNPVRGCTKVSPGCANCYAETFAERFRGVKGHPYEQGFDLRLVREKLSEPFSWKKPRRVFVNSMSDLFQDGVPDAFIDECFAVMAACRFHTFQVLTKRPERMRAFFSQPRSYVSPTMGCKTSPLPNVWLGVSVENRKFRGRISQLQRTPAAIRFVSFEPLLEDLGDLQLGREWCAMDECPIDWAIVGGESGPGARRCDLAWVRSIVQQCQQAKIAVFVKQLGAAPESIHEHLSFRGSKTARPDGFYRFLNSRRGGDQSEWPLDLRIREFPAVSRLIQERE